MLSNFIIPGAQKCGTTSLHHYLINHTQCLLSDPKETNFFYKWENMERLGEYEKYFKVPQGVDSAKIKVIGEVATGYLYDVHIPQRLKVALSDDLKLIFILRNPVDRAISAYWHLYKTYHEKRNIETVLRLDSQDIEGAVQQESTNLQRAIKEGMVSTDNLENLFDDYLWPFHYINNSRYSTHIINFLQYFDRKNMLFVFTEELKTFPVRVLHKIEDFLEIEYFVPKNLKRIYNRTLISKGTGIFKPINVIANLIPMSIKQMLSGIYHKFSMIEKPASMEREDVRKYLEGIFLREKKELGDLIDLDIGEFWDI